MAALVEGQQYGLSAQDKINCTKSLVFVKLTDSALRSIEEYVKNKGETVSKPTIQFQNSSGVISLPQNGSRQTFGFTLSNVEADGPHGSFECLRQTGPRSIESLGCMQVKMHIHATEDSYENTKVKMAAVEEQQKKSCTKVIKPAGAHLGRKVKVKRPGMVVSPVKFSPPTASMINKAVPMKPMTISPPAPSPSFPVKRPEPSRLPLPNKERPEPPRLPLPNKERPEPPRLPLPNKERPEPPRLPLPNKERPEPPRPPPPNKERPEPLRKILSSCVNQLGKAHWDRIIHILAVRPYKRPELLIRLKHEGVKEKDKNKLTSILPQISVLKGNIYYLANYLWNEVQDNWKFCTQEELEIIRKRKQQYLSSNNESETSPSNSQTSTSPLQKRFASEVIPNEHPPSKKQRISHYKADQPRPSFGGSATDSSSNNFIKKSYSPGPVHSSITNGFSHQDESSQKSPISNGCDSYPTTPPKSVPNNVLSTSSLNQRTNTREDNEKGIRSHTSGLNHSGGPMRRSPSKPSFHKSHPSSRNSRHDGDESSLQLDSVSSSKTQLSPDSDTKGGTCSKTTINGYVNSNSINRSNYNGNPSFYVNRSKNSSTTNGSCSNSPHSSCDSRDSIDYNHNSIQVPPPTESPSPCDSPEYEKEYSTIVSSEQRALYKSHFNAEYQEYLCLHKKINSISKKFASLERHLYLSPKGSDEFMKIKGKIYKEYRAYQQDPSYIEALKKFNFLHNKLAYIKRLVSEYDNAQCAKS
ncbi:RNA polymerase II elongation factor ELL2 [Trichonephila inaurata madagascariensis]|uniref:RNA polymerase II elongation factor ELL2 n=1 Tax=Trichonephila inaurata madagascariensis TaxID=2747483 RepID=A0A8X6YN25_9ARAC|nr:RNA polymerase II elongation factor ELL2 [Trichonephila inaurata madagascariensis]